MRPAISLLSICFTAQLIFGTASAGTIPGLDELKVPYKTAEKKFGVRGSREDTMDRDKSDNKVLEVQVGPLTQAQFGALSKIAQGSFDKPAFKAGATYKLEQFLPPAIQALIGKQFRPIDEPYTWPTVDPTDEGVEAADLTNYADLETPLSTLINCWTTAYEVLRTWKAGTSVIDITWLSRSSATQTITVEQFDQLKKEDKRQFGDLIVFSAFDEGPSEDLVQHAAVLVVPGLYFEKTDSSQDDAFRFVTEKDLLAKYKKNFKSKLKLAHYRLKVGAELARLADSRNLTGSREFYEKYFSEADMKTIAMEFDWMPSFAGPSKPKFFPFRIHSIAIEKTAGGYVLDPKSAIAGSFQKPKAP